MGFLNAGFGSASGSANASQSWGLLSTGLNAVSGLSSGFGQGSQLDYQAQVAANNAAITRANAGSQSLADSYNESLAKTRGGLEVAQTKAQQSGSGLDVNVGSTVSTRQSMQTVNAMDAAVLHYNASLKSLASQNEAASLDAQSKADRLAADQARIGGIAKFGASLLSGASSLQGKAAGYKLSAPVGG